jgi:hypothetical protein
MLFESAALRADRLALSTGALRMKLQHFKQLRTEWSQFASTDTKACTVKTTIGCFKSYVELLTWLGNGKLPHDRQR